MAIALIALVVGAFVASLPSKAIAAGDDGASSGKAAAPPASASDDIRLKFFLQKRFRLPDPDDVTIGPPARSSIRGLYLRPVTLTSGNQSARFDLYINAAKTSAILTDVRLGPATPGPIKGLWSRPVVSVAAPGQPTKSQLITDSPSGGAIIGSTLDLTQDPWGRVDLNKLHLDDRATLGPADAPVTIIEFGDFECPFCARAFGDIEALVTTTYKDKVRLIFKNYPLNIHPWATPAAIAAECVRRQNPDAFWQFAHDLYRDQSDINPQNLRSHVDQYASQLGLDQGALNACIAGNSATARVEEDRRDGDVIQINSTPTFLIDGIEVVGLPADKTFNFVIDSELKAHHAKP